ncbi:myb-related protein 330-like isoform X2 [Zingiber officinale]|uniref:Uncharacterized protein n=2 Tax=Zingiber officinale TaxID=94328 RepID=A0A8J5H6R4_ZINOF|nr:myb-related protein 330-like isoform X2 [Zingiber officinale]XP_042472616.1 myb-related protein 330-like isoform X2 [Zingiber officinale]XP_042472617.1 myb-related protein 330-like isoform X2 [Zingiber officinale]KAG6516877.1 hypothetical protein ZIOFF_020250 [Zingiber officinale]
MGRSPCCEKAHTNRGAWTKEEDQLLISYIRAYGEGCWRSLPKAAGLQRCGKSCRLRWINYLRPDLKRGNFTEEEDELIIKLHSIIGNKWSVIAGQFSGRTDNEIKNYWNTRIKRKLIARGLNPKTHLPLDGSSDHSALSCDRQIMPLAIAPQSDNRLRIICFCYHLGFRGSEACSCGTSYDQYLPLEERQQA